MTRLTSFTWSQKVGENQEKQIISVKSKEHIPELW